MRREKVHVPSGCESRPATVAPAGSHRSVAGGNELDDASGVAGRPRRPRAPAGPHPGAGRARHEPGDAETDPLEVANKVTAPMYIVNPLRKMREAHQAINSMFVSHPPIKERVARLLALAR